jgi:hypothetical protein
MGSLNNNKTFINNVLMLGKFSFNKRPKVYTVGMYSKY